MYLDEIKTKKIMIAGRGFPAIYDYLMNEMSGVRAKIVDHDRLSDEIKDTHVLIPAMSIIDSDLLRKASQLLLIQQWGAGLEGVDIETSTLLNIPVANVPTAGTGNCESVAEWYIMSVLNLCRKTCEIRSVVETVSGWGTPIGQALYGKTAGIIGFGGIGKALAKRLKPFGMKVIAIQQHPDKESAEEIGLDWIGKEEDLRKLLEQSNFLFLCLPLNKGSRHLLNEETIAMLPKGAYVFNAARGSIIEKQSFIRYLREGRIGGAALDVYWKEPPAPNDPITRFPNVLLTPHIAGVTDYSYQGIAHQVANNISRIFKGLLPIHCANPEVKPSWLLR
jgi:phosphoglycerate dehydrogenase-like enzyme